MSKTTIVHPENNMIAKPSLKKTTTQRKWQKQLFKQLNAAGPQIFLGLLLMLSLFMSESWILGNAPDSTNAGLYGTLTAVFCIFVIETVLLCLVQEDYFLGFFFWMDLVGTLSILLDIGWIADLFLPSGTVSGQGSVLRATRAAKLGARYGRLLRLLKLMRFTRYMPCFGMSGEDTFEPTMSAIKKVSEELSSVLSLRTAALVMIMVIVVPFLSYTVSDYSPNAWVDNIKVLAKNPGTDYSDIENIARKCNNFYKPKDSRLKYIKIESPWIESAYIEDFRTRRVIRDENIITFKSDYEVANNDLLSSGNPYAAGYVANSTLNGRDSRTNYTLFQVEVNIDDTYQNQQNAMFGILLIILVIFVLFLFTASFSSAVNRLVVQPLEKMMSTLRNSAMLMLKSLKAVEEEKDEKGKKKGASDDDGDSEDDDEEMETAMLEKMVEKLSRIVAHVLPNQNELNVGENVDRATSTWLNQSYTSNLATKLEARGRDHVASDSEEKERLKALEESLTMVSKEQINSWDFDVLQYSNEELVEVVTFIFSLLNLLQEFKIPQATFMRFVTEISGRYVNSNTYHNFKHGCDVCHTSYRLLMIPQLDQVFNTLEIFSVLVGALSHDVGHPGINNHFLVKAKHELALQHNDRSPLENMHCVVLYELLAKPELNIFEALSDPEWREARKIILTIILGTDMSHHFEQISKTQLFVEVNGEDSAAFCSGEKDTIDCLKDDKNRMFIMELVLHCSDISNPFKPYALCSKWADLVVAEFCSQGDQEKALGLEVSPMCDRDAINLCNMQMGFIEFVVAPLIIAFVNILPPLYEIGDSMCNNFEMWGSRRLGELNGTMSAEEKESDSGNAKETQPLQAPTAAELEEAKKLEERIKKFKDRMSFTAGLKAKPRRQRRSSAGVKKVGQ